MAMYITFIDQGSFNLIVSAQRENTFQLPNATTIEVFDSNLFTLILENLADRKTIRFHKEVETLTADNITVFENEDLIKNSYIFSLYAAAAKVFSKIPQYTYFRYTYLNNLFNSLGYFITEGNREEVYIKILETEKDDLIDKLEEYLKIMNILNQHEKIYQAFLNALSDMEVIDDEAQLDVILKEAIEFFKSSEKNFVKVDERGWFSTIKNRVQDERIEEAAKAREAAQSQE